MLIPLLIVVALAVAVWIATPSPELRRALRESAEPVRDRIKRRMASIRRELERNDR